MSNYFLSNPFRAPHKTWNPNKEELKWNSVPDLEELRRTQYPPEFEEIDTFAKNRMVMGRFRYGDIERQNLSAYDTVKEAHKRLDRYSNSHNLEDLVDTLNMIKIEYKKAKAKGYGMFSIDDGEHSEPTI